jgi:hypothetical protein
MAREKNLCGDAKQKTLVDFNILTRRASPDKASEVQQKCVGRSPHD